MPNLGSTSTNGGTMAFGAGARGMVLSLPVGAGKTLDSVALIKPPGFGRVSAYVGGTEADPSGAALLGTVTFPAGSSGATVPETVSFGGLALPNSGLLRLLVQTGGNFSPATSDEAGKGDWLGARYESSAISNDPTPAPPAEWPADEGSVGSTYLYMQVGYTAGGGGGGGGNTAPTLSIDQGPAASLVEGDTLQLTATVADAEDEPDPVIQWGATNPAIAAVSSGGLVTAVGPGTAEITADVEDSGGETASDSITITVTAAPPGGDAVTYTAFAIRAGRRGGLSNAVEVEL